VTTKDGDRSYLEQTDPMIDALLYPFIFPYGDLGWRIDMPRNPVQRPGNKNRRTRVTIREYYRAMLQLIDNSENIILRCGRVLQQFITDVWLRVVLNKYVTSFSLFLYIIAYKHFLVIAVKFFPHIYVHRTTFFLFFYLLIKFFSCKHRLNPIFLVSQ
jgi:hypothetical protein